MLVGLCRLLQPIFVFGNEQKGLAMDGNGPNDWPTNQRNGMRAAKKSPIAEKHRSDQASSLSVGFNYNFGEIEAEPNRKMPPWWYDHFRSMFR